MNIPTELQNAIKAKFEVEQFYNGIDTILPGQIRSLDLSVPDNNYPQDMWEPVNFLVLEEIDECVFSGFLVFSKEDGSQIHSVNLTDEMFRKNTPHISCLRSIPLYFGWFQIEKKDLGKIVGEVESPNDFKRMGLEYVIRANEDVTDTSTLPYYDMLCKLKL